MTPAKDVPTAGHGATICTGGRWWRHGGIEPKSSGLSRVPGTESHSLRRATSPLLAGVLSPPWPLRGDLAAPRLP